MRQAGIVLMYKVCVKGVCLCQEKRGIPLLSQQQLLQLLLSIGFYEPNQRPLLGVFLQL